MLGKKAKEKSRKATLLAVQKEMAKPRVAKSARGEQTGRIKSKTLPRKAER
jgi:hypothetical protein